MFIAPAISAFVPKSKISPIKKAVTECTLRVQSATAPSVLGGSKAGSAHYEDSCLQALRRVSYLQTMAAAAK